MTNKKQLSIIIVNYNTKEILEICLEYLFADIKASKVNAEIILIDNGSSDGSRKYLKKLVNGQWSMVNRKKKNQPNSKSQNSIPIFTIFNDKNLGFSKAVNQGMEIAKGKNVLLLNSDTRIKPHTIKKLLAFVDQTQDAGVVGPKLINSDGTIQPSCFNFPTIGKAMREFWFGREKAFSKYYPRTKTPTEVDALVGAVFLITQPALNKVGKFDEKYFLYYEDLDYCQRVWQSGLKVYYHPQIEVVHEHGASGKKISDKTKKWLIESSKKYHGVIKHYLINFVIWTGQKWQKILN